MDKTEKRTLVVGMSIGLFLIGLMLTHETNREKCARVGHQYPEVYSISQSKVDKHGKPLLTNRCDNCLNYRYIYMKED